MFAFLPGGICLHCRPHLERKNSNRPPTAAIGCSKSRDRADEKSNVSCHRTVHRSSDGPRKKPMLTIFTCSFVSDGRMQMNRWAGLWVGQSERPSRDSLISTQWNWVDGGFGCQKIVALSASPRVSQIFKFYWNEAILYSRHFPRFSLCQSNNSRNFGRWIVNLDTNR